MYFHRKEGIGKLATRYPSDYDNRSRVEPGISRSSRSGSYSGQRSPGRSGASRPAYSSQRPSGGQRPPQRRPSGQRPSGGQRPPQRPGTPPRRSSRKRKPNRMPLFAALAAVLVIVLVLVIVKPFGRRGNDVVTDGVAVPASNTVTGDTSAPASDALLTAGDDGDEQAPQYDNLADKLADADYDVGSLSAENMAQVSDLRLNTNLPADWLNVLLLGTDERYLNTSARTDTMMICSINRTTGEVKLASIMRDLAVDLHDIGKYSGTWRMNAANYFGGPNLTMRTINECFGMNLQYYVMVNFFGFQRIAERLGGIDIDVSEEEMEQINKWAWNSYKIAYYTDTDISDVVYEKLETFGENTHLNGTQALAYARIRKLNGGDYMRSERQRKVLAKLLDKAKQLNAMEIASLASLMQDQVKTNMPWDDIINTAIAVAANGLSGMENMQLPVNGTFKQETRNNQSMLYDCDFTANTTQLYNFIYE